MDVAFSLGTWEAVPMQLSFIFKSKLTVKYPCIVILLSHSESQRIGSHVRVVSVSESNVLLDEEVLTDPKVQALLLTVLVSGPPLMTHTATYIRYMYTSTHILPYCMYTVGHMQRQSLRACTDT